MVDFTAENEAAYQEDEAAYQADHRVRRAHVDDAAPIADVHIAAWRSAYRGIMAAEVLDSLDLDRQTAGWTRNLGDEESPMTTFVVVDGPDAVKLPDAGKPRIVGFGGVCPPRDSTEVLGRLPDTSGLGQLAFINLHPDAFGTGAAVVLIRALADHLRTAGFTRAYLMVAEGNDRAIRFYEKNGWQRTDITHVYEGVSPAIPERMFTIELS